MPTVKSLTLVLFRMVRRRIDPLIGQLLVLGGFSNVKKVFSLHEKGKGVEKSNCSDLQYEVFWPESVQHRRPPSFEQSEAPEVKSIFAHETQYTMPVGGIIKCSGFIVGEPAAVVTRDGLLLKEPSRQIAKDIFQQPVIRKRKLLPERKLKRVFFASFDQGSTFYHWFFDVLPLLLVPEFRKQLTSETTIICPPIPYSYQRESLAMAGLEGLDLLPVDSFECIEADEIVVPVLPQTTGHQHQNTIETLRATFLTTEVNTANRKGGKIYISRRKALRGLANEAEILKELETAGFKMVVLEDMALSEQLALFASADTVIAPHGAGLTHIVFMPSVSRVIELFSRKFINPCYWRLAAACGHEYGVITGSPAGNTVRPEQDSYRVEFGRLESKILGRVC